MQSLIFLILFWLIFWLFVLNSFALLNISSYNIFAEFSILLLLSSSLYASATLINDELNELLFSFLRL